MLSLAGLVFLPATFCLAQVVPTSPSPGQSFASGQSCSMKWRPDTTGAWTSLSIDFMSGSNDNMSLVTNIVSGLDRASLSSYSWTCPEVDPYSAIYFYQFSSKDQNAHGSPTWTSRFTLVSDNGSSTAPQHSTQPNGDAIPWGIGHLIQDNTKYVVSSITTSLDVADTSGSIMASQSPPAALTIVTSPEMTLNVPPPRPTKHTPRSGFSTVYIHVGESDANSVARPTARCQRE